jgi:glutamine cyclotransferase
MRLILYIILPVLLFSCGNKSNSQQDVSQLNIRTTESASIEKDTVERVEYDFKLLRKIPHDINAFTQGLLFHEGFLYESTGQHGESTLRKVNPATGQVLKSVPIGAQYFGEGIAIKDGKIYFLTWTAGKCFVYDLETFELEREIDYYEQGWGLTTYGDYLLKSDGSNFIRFVDPQNLEVQKTLSIYDGISPVQYLNELEMIYGELWANVWMLDRIIRINPETGDILGWIEMKFLRDEIEGSPGAEVLNGIAFDEENNEVYITGKNWPYYFVFEFFEKK